MRPVILLVTIIAGLMAGACDPGGGMEADDPAYEEARGRFLTQLNGGNPEAALAEARAALELAPSVEDAYIWSSKLYSDLGRDEAGAEFFGSVAEAHPRTAHPWLYKGRHEYQLRRFEDALDSFTRCTELDPKRARCFHWRGVVLQIRGAQTDALTALERAYELDPRWVNTTTRLVDSLRVAGEYERAEEVALAGLAGSPDSARLQHAAGQLRLRAQDHAAAEPRLRRAIELDPYLREAYADLARLLHRTDRAEEAAGHEATAARLQDYEEAKRNMASHLGTTGDPAPPMLMGEIELTERRFDEAVNWFLRSQGLGGVGTRSLAGLAEALYRLGDTARGDVVMERVGDADDPRLDLALAARLVAEGDLAGSAVLIARAVERGPEEREFLRRAADLYVDAGQPGEAVVLLERAASAPRASTEQ